VENSRNIQHFWVIQDPVKRMATMLVHGLLHKDYTCTTTEEVKVWNALAKEQNYVNNIIADPPIRRIQAKFMTSSPEVDPQNWFLQEFERAVKSLGSQKKWFNITTLMIYVQIMMQAAGRFLDDEMKCSFENILVKFICEDFRDFIENAGGWEAYVKYASREKKIVQNRVRKARSKIVGIIVVGGIITLIAAIIVGPNLMNIFGP